MTNPSTQAPVPATADDPMALLASAAALYEQYLAVAEIGRIPSEMEIAAASMPQPYDLPLTLRIHAT